MKIYEDSVAHLEKHKMNYIEHFTISFYFGTALFVGSIKAFVHCIIPGLFPTSTTDLSESLNDLIHKRD